VKKASYICANRGGPMEQVVEGEVSKVRKFDVTHERGG